MPERRFYCPMPFTPNTTVKLEGEELHHLRVMRVHPEETVELVNGQSQLALAKLQSLEKKHAELHIEEVHEQSPPPKKLILVQAIPRLNRLDTIIEKTTELGVSEIHLFPGEYSEKKELSPTQKNRVEMITISAMKQSGRLDKPQIFYEPPLLKSETPSGELFFGDITEDAPSLLKTLENKQLPEKTYFYIGPEKGFSEKEIDHLKYHNVRGVSLHHNILRTDTAPIVALAIATQFL